MKILKEMCIRDRVSSHLKENSAYDLAILDVMLPGKDGFELLPEIRKARIPVIFLTAKSDLGSKIRGLKAGAEDYLVNPLSLIHI